MNAFFDIISDDPRIRESHLKIHQHGHRCYLHGLNASELAIVHILANGLSYKDYFIFNNIIVPSENSGTTQIDHIVVSKFGIFVIESKEYKGWIFGDANKPEWTQFLLGGKKYRFYNPLLQNYSHVAALKEQLHFLGADKFFNTVVFLGECEFKTHLPENVMLAKELIYFIRSKNEKKIKEVELLVVIGKLSMLCQTMDISKEQHTDHIHAYLERKKRNDSTD